MKTAMQCQNSRLAEFSEIRKEELPLAQNLEDPIVQALNSTRWLVVICSTKLQDSMWCRKEIETFLALRGRENILVTLVEGDAATSIPRILWPKELQDKETLSEDEKKTLYDADFRGEDDKAIDKKVRQDYLRIVAPIIGKEYSDFIKTYHEIITRRKILGYTAVVSFFAVVALYFTALSVKMFLDNRTIQRQYNTIFSENALIIAEEALAALDNDDREGAISLALDALYSYKNISPSKGKLALFNALHPYDTGSEYKAKYSLEFDGEVLYIVTNKNCEYALVYDSSDTLTYIDYKNQSVKYSIAGIELKADGFALNDDNKFAYINADDHVVVIDAESGEELFTANDQAYREIFASEDAFFFAYNYAIDCLITTSMLFTEQYYQTPLSDIVFYVDKNMAAFDDMGVASVTVPGYEEYRTSQTINMSNGNNSFRLEQILAGKRDEMITTSSTTDNSIVCKDTVLKDGKLYFLVCDRDISSPSTLSTRLDSIGWADISLLDSNNEFKKTKVLSMYQPADYIRVFTGVDGKNYILTISDSSAVLFDEAANVILSQSFKNSLIAIEENENQIICMTSDGRWYRFSDELEKCGEMTAGNDQTLTLDYHAGAIQQIYRKDEYVILSEKNGKRVIFYTAEKNDELSPCKEADLPAGFANTVSDEIYTALDDLYLSRDSLTYYGNDAEDNHYFGADEVGYVVNGAGELVGQIERFAGFDSKNNMVYVKDRSNQYYCRQVVTLDQLAEMGRQVIDDAE